MEKSAVVSRPHPAAVRLVACLWMLAVGVMGVVFACVGYRSFRADYRRSAPETVPLDGVEALSLLPEAAERFGVASVAAALDARKQVGGYVVVTEEPGYRSTIRVCSTFSADGRRLVGMRVLSQNETEYLGARISDERFAAAFSGRKMPVKLAGSPALGAAVDGLSGSTVSAEAVVRAVNNAQKYLLAAGIVE